MPGSNIEANSLSDITQIAANPPKYPRNPTESKRPPLTLYIARVPGSRDVILTTLKPLLKNVTAEDVAASLYYLHLDTDDDARLLEEEAANIPPYVDRPAGKPLPRKPLPESAKPSLDLSRPTMRGSVDLDPGLPKRKPVSGGLESQQTSQSSDRRPLGPRSLVSKASMTRKPLLGLENRPPLRQQDSSQKPKSSIDTARSLKTEIQNHGSASTKSFSITLIRRDLSSGAQWNVGTVVGYPVGGAAASGRTKKPIFDMSIQLMTPGYNQFQARRSTIPPGADADPQTRREDIHPPTAPLEFERKVRMGGRPAMQHARTRSDFSSKGSAARGSSDSPGFGSPETTTPGDNTRHATGYTFLSPWQGQCQFSTSISGRSLKCKHHLPAPISAGSSSMSTSSAIVSELRFNLPSGVFNSSPSPESRNRSSVESSRFSIPKFGNIREKLNSHKKRPEDSSRLDPTSYAAMYPSDEEETPHLPPRPNLASQQRGSYDMRRSPNFRQQSPESHSASSEDEGDRSRLDLSIGREKAGGGNRGKRAKLGKLIIQDEGFKMLDLVVAANMCVWWSVWEGA